MARRYDALIVGGGHNGLVAGCYLAKAGLSVLVLERREILGGACVTEELFPGFHISAASYTVGLLQPEVIEPRRTAGLAWIDVEPDIAVADGDGALGARIGRGTHAEGRFVELALHRIVVADEGDVL